MKRAVRRELYSDDERFGMPTLLPSGLRENAQYGTAGMPALDFIGRMTGSTGVA